MTEDEINYHPKEIDNDLIDAARAAAHAFDDNAATTLEKGSEPAVFLEIRKWCSIMNRKKTELDIPLLSRADEEDIGQQTHVDLVGLELIIGYGIICSRRFGVTPNDPKFTIDRWYSWWNGWWSDLSLAERKQITNEGNFDIALADQLKPKIDWKEMIEEANSFHSQPGAKEEPVLKPENNITEKELKDEELDALLGQLKDAAKTTIQDRTTVSMSDAESSIASILGADTVKYISDMSQLKLFHFVRENAEIITAIAKHFNVSNPMNIQNEVTDREALVDYFMAKTLIRMGMIVINKRCGVTFHAPGIDGFDGAKNDEFRRWLCWWEVWERALTVDRLIVNYIATQVEMGFDTYILPSGDWRNVTSEQALALTDNKDEKPKST